MVLGRNAPSFPRFLSKQQFDFNRFRKFTVFASPLLHAIESVSRPRWNARRDVTDRLVGLIVFLLALSAGWPLPFGERHSGFSCRSDRHSLLTRRRSLTGCSAGGCTDFFARASVDTLGIGPSHHELAGALNSATSPTAPAVSKKSSRMLGEVAR
jgi:hypothetical protein